ncbi:MAG: hypothetical protein U0271_38015 [Polyangiaceae bacterium]
MSLRKLAPLALAALAALTPACAPGNEVDDLEDTEQGEKRFSSDEATLVDFEFDGMLTAPWQTNTTKLIKDQLFYMVGQLNEHRSVARLDKVTITNVKRTSNGADGWMKVTFHAKLPVGWGEGDAPSTFDLTFPRKIGPKSLTTFTDTYKGSCVDEDGHDVNSGNFWFHFRPEREGCTFDPAHISTTTAKVTVSTLNTTGKFPEYDKVWEDGTLRVVAVFGKYEDYSTSQSDAGIQAYNEFIDTVRETLGAGLTTTPANVASSPGVSAPDVTFSGTIDGANVSITALLIDSPKVATPTFDARYGELTKTADVITYNGHAGLGANVRALASKGQFTKGRYSVFFFNGCDTFAYLDDKLSGRFATLNPDDAKGTKYLDVVTNLMPAYFSSMPTASLAIVGALAHPNAPRTYQQIFSGIDSQQVVVVTGEEDNVYVPKATGFAGMDEAGSVGKGESKTYETPTLPAGKYTISLSEKGTTAGDADLYVGVGYQPTLEMWDERPYLVGSNEEVTIELKTPSKLFVMVHGYEDAPVTANAFRLVVEQD